MTQLPFGGLPRSGVGVERDEDGVEFDVDINSLRVPGRSRAGGILSISQGRGSKRISLLKESDSGSAFGWYGGAKERKRGVESKDAEFDAGIVFPRLSFANFGKDESYRGRGGRTLVKSPSAQTDQTRT